MSKTFRIEVDCANCANLVEDAAKKVSGVKEGTDPETVMSEILKVAKKVEPDFEIF